MGAMVYVAKRDCGCIVAATVDRKVEAKRISIEVGAWIKDELTVDRVPADEVMFFAECPHVRPLNQQLTFEDVGVDTMTVSDGSKSVTVSAEQFERVATMSDEEFAALAARAS